MAETLELEIATPEKLLIREAVDQVQLPGANGYLGILPGHAPLLSELGTGVVTYSNAGRTRTMSLSGGFVEVANNRVRVLADSAERADEIDLKRANEAFLRAKERLDSPAETIDVSRALNAYKRAQARLEAAGGK